MSATRLPSVLTRAEVHALLGELQGVHRLIAGLLYGSGLRLPEALRLRAKDLDWEMHQLTIRDGKELKDRVSVLPRQLAQPLAEHLRRVRRLHQRDRSEGFGAVYLPFALERKYPGAASAWGWQFVFPSRGRSADPRSGAVRRHHLSETAVQAAVRRAARRAGIARPAGCHALRHSFAAHLLEDGHDIRTVEELLGHADVRTTGVHTSVPDRGGGAVRSPLDAGTPARSPAAQELPGIILR